jgi:hypothetical protein
MREELLNAKRTYKIIEWRSERFYTAKQQLSYQRFGGAGIVTRLRGRLKRRRPLEPDPGNTGGGRKIMNQRQISSRIRKPAFLDKLEAHLSG